MCMLISKHAGRKSYYILTQDFLLDPPYQLCFAFELMKKHNHDFVCTRRLNEFLTNSIVMLTML